MGEQYLAVGEVARRLGVRPRDLSDALYSGTLDRSRCVLAGGRWLLPMGYLAEAARILAHRGGPGTTKGQSSAARSVARCA